MISTEPTRRQQARLLIPILAVVFTAALDLTSVAPLLSTMIFDLGIGAVDADRYAWIVLAYLVAYTVTVPVTGRLSDYAGRMPVFSVALSLFTLGSIVAALADNLGWMIVGRTLQGLGGGAMLPVSMALIADVVPAIRRASALGLVAAADTFGWVLGPVYGSAINGIFGTWRAVFWTNLPICALAVVALVLIRRYARQTRAPRIPNLLSATLATAGLVAVTLALSSGSEGALGPEQGGQQLGGSANPMAPYRWYLLGLGIVSLIGFAISEWKSRTPLLPTALIRQKLFQYAVGANILVGAALIVAMVNAPLVIALLAERERTSSLTAVLLGSFTVAMTIGAVLGGRFLNAVGARWMAAAGLFISALGYFSMTQWGHELELPIMSGTIAIAGFGLGIVIAPLAESAIASAGLESYGSASGLVLLARLLGMTFGLAAITRFGLDRLSARVAELDPLPPQPGETTSQYFARQQTYLDEQVIPLTLDVIEETFIVAGLICLATILLVSRMRARRSASGEWHP